jgi:hypothetical protein
MLINQDGYHSTVAKNRDTSAQPLAPIQHFESCTYPQAPDMLIDETISEPLIEDCVVTPAAPTQSRKSSIPNFQYG